MDFGHVSRMVPLVLSLGAQGLHTFLSLTPELNAIILSHANMDSKLIRFTASHGSRLRWKPSRIAAT